jgi:hypothetical protein
VKQSQWLGLALVACVGCDVVSSEDLSTSEIRADIVVTTSADGLTKIQTTLGRHHSIDDRVQLAEGDRLIANANGQDVILSEHDNVFDDIGYVGTLANLSPGTAVRVRFRRDSGSDADAVVTIPEGFHLDTPTHDASLPIRSAVAVSWSGGEPGRDVELHYDADCDQGGSSGSKSEDDDGSAKLSIDVSNSDHVQSRTCSVDLKVRRRADGDLSGPWSGSITGQQERSVTFGLE